jgi:hypothetical protein
MWEQRECARRRLCRITQRQHQCRCALGVAHTRKATSLLGVFRCHSVEIALPHRSSVTPRLLDCTRAATVATLASYPRSSTQCTHCSAVDEVQKVRGVQGKKEQLHRCKGDGQLRCIGCHHVDPIIIAVGISAATAAVGPRLFTVVDRTGQTQTKG